MVIHFLYCLAGSEADALKSSFPVRGSPRKNPLRMVWVTLGVFRDTSCRKVVRVGSLSMPSFAVFNAHVEV